MSLRYFYVTLTSSEAEVVRTHDWFHLHKWEQEVELKDFLTEFQTKQAYREANFKKSWVIGIAI